MIKRFERPIEGQEFESEYDFPSSEIQDLIGRCPVPVSVIKIDLGTAGTRQITEPGEGFSLFAFDTAGAKATEAFIKVGVSMRDTSDSSRCFPLKTSRGFVGSFPFLALEWSAQAGLVGYLIIHKSKKMPWFGGNENT